MKPTTMTGKTKTLSDEETPNRRRKAFVSGNLTIVLWLRDSAVGDSWRNETTGPVQLSSRRGRRKAKKGVTRIENGDRRKDWENNENLLPIRLHQSTQQ